MLLLLATQVSMERPKSDQSLSPDLGSPIVVQVVSQQVWVVNDKRALWETSDGGRTWTTISQPGPSSSVGFGGFHFLNGRTGFIVDRGRFLRTTDGGATWNLMGEVSAYITSFTFVDEERGWAIGVTGAGTAEARPAALSTQDGGKTWQNLTLPELEPDDAVLRSVFFYDSKNGWIAGDGCILRTRDGGEHWAVVYQDRDIHEEVFFSTGQLGWATMKNSGDFVLSEDAGSHWVRVNGPQPYGDWPSRVVCTTKRHCLVSSFRLYMTGDGGGTWKQVSAGMSHEYAYFGYVGMNANGDLLALGTLDEARGGAFAMISVDGGASWRRITGGKSSNVVGP